MIALGLLVLAVSAQAEDVEELKRPPDPPSAVAAMRRIWATLEREEVNLRRAKLIDALPEIPGYAPAYTFLAVSAPLLLGGAGLLIAGIRVGGIGGGAMAFLGVIVAAVGLGLLIAGIVRYHRITQEREESAELRKVAQLEIKELDSQIRALDRIAPPAEPGGRSPFAVPLIGH